MAVRSQKIHPALKHGGYSATTLLPGEDRAEYEKLHRDLIADIAPRRAIEDDIVTNLARIMWRRKNLSTFRLAELARKRSDAIRSEKLRTFELPILSYGGSDPAEIAEAHRASEGQAREELGITYELVEIGDTATIKGLIKELEVEERLDSLYDKCLKRLLFVRGLKSISSGSAETPSASPPPRIRGPSKAA